MAERGDNSGKADESADLEPGQQPQYDPGIDPERGIDPDLDAAPQRSLTEPAQQNARNDNEQNENEES
ncbi:hypothetical protein GCM10027403_15660 [Arthrobacter tecti]